MSFFSSSSSSCILRLYKTLLNKTLVIVPIFTYLSSDFVNTLFPTNRCCQTLQCTKLPYLYFTSTFHIYSHLDIIYSSYRFRWLPSCYLYKCKRPQITENYPITSIFFLLEYQRLRNGISKILDNRQEPFLDFSIQGYTTEIKVCWIWLLRIY